MRAHPALQVQQRASPCGMLITHSAKASDDTGRKKDGARKNFSSSKKKGHYTDFIVDSTPRNWHVMRGDQEPECDCSGAAR